MAVLPFQQIDVFSKRPFSGNPLAVVIALNASEADVLDDGIMQSFANWTNLSETTFILPPSDPSKADYKVRIFTTTRELPFAGHPTVGSCRAFLEAGGKPRTQGKVVQECGLGLIDLKLDPDGSIYFTAPELRMSGRVDDETVRTACDIMSISPSNVLSAEWAVTGPKWFALELRDAQAVLSVNCKPAMDIPFDFEWGIWGKYAEGEGPDVADIEVRTFFDRAMLEDPATGSFAAGLAVCKPSIAKDGQFLISQGTRLGRQARINVKYEGDKIWIGGHSNISISGTVCF